MKTIQVVINTADIFVEHTESGPEIWIPATPATLGGETITMEDGRFADVHAVMIVKTPIAYSRLFAGKTFPEPVQIAIRDWGEEQITLPDGSIDVVCRKAGFAGGNPLPAPTLDALTKEMKLIDDFYRASMESDSPVKHDTVKKPDDGFDWDSDPRI